MNSVIKKMFAKLTNDYFRDSSLYDEENCFIPAGTEGVIIDERTISLISNLSDENYSEIVSREIRAKENAAYLLLINGRIITVPVGQLEIRYDPPHPIFEDEEDWKQWMDEQFEFLRKDPKEDIENAST